MIVSQIWLEKMVSDKEKQAKSLFYLTTTFFLSTNVKETQKISLLRGQIK